MARLKTQVVVIDNKDVIVECPNCKAAEGHPIDEQRHHLQNFEIVEWLENNKQGLEVSKMLCSCCKKHFNLIWDYSNKDNEPSENLKLVRSIKGDVQMILNGEWDISDGIENNDVKSGFKTMLKQLKKIERSLK
jgi:hypothetical protein